MKRTPEWLSRLALSTVSIVVFLVVMEATLRLAGFEYVLELRDVEFGRPEPVLLELAFLPDDDLFWVTRDYAAKLARLRAEGPEVVFLGDSCTQWGRYDEALAARVRERSGRLLRFGNLAVAGWSTHQGLAQLRRDVVPLRPKVVTLYFGWNDHWIGFGIEDAEVARIRSIFTGRFRGSRLVQLVTKAAVALEARRNPHPNRVPLPDFRRNLREMAEAAEAAGIAPVFLTAPSAHVEGQEPKELAERWLRDLSELVPLHRAYASAVREVGREEEVVVCDLAAEFDRLPIEARQRLFSGDGIHLSDEGNQVVASILDRCLAAARLLG